MKVRKSQLRASVLTLVYRLSVVDVFMSLLIGASVGLFVFFVSGRMDLHIEAQRAGITNEIWRALFTWLPARLSPGAATLTHRIMGSAAAGFTAWSDFMLLRSAYFMILVWLHVDDFLRIRRQVYLWLMGVPLTIFVSLSSKELFSMFMPETFFFMLAVGATMLMVCYFLTKRIFFAIFSCFILGVLSAMSLLGVACLFLLVFMVSMARVHSVLPSVMSESGSGYGYGGYGGYGYRSYGDRKEDEEEDFAPVTVNTHLTNPFVMDRLRLAFSFFYLVGFVLSFGTLFFMGTLSGMDPKSIVLDWVGCMSGEFHKLVTLNGVALIVGGVVVPMIFVFKDLHKMLDDEYFISMLDIVRLLVSIALVLAMLVLLDRLLPNNVAVVCRSVQLVVQTFAGLVCTVAISVFLVDIKCRKNVRLSDFEDMELDMGSSFKFLMKPILFIITVLPLVMIAASFLIAK